MQARLRCWAWAVLLAGCAGGRPAWVSGPSPAIGGGQRCHHDGATGIAERDEALRVARDRAMGRVLADVSLEVESDHVSYQEEGSGELRVWVGERTVSRAIGSVWGVIERDRFVEDGAAWVQLCLPEATYAEMRAAVARQGERLRVLVGEQLARVEAARAGGRLAEAIEAIDLAAAALADLPAGSDRDEIAARIESAARALEAGVALHVEGDGAIAAGAAAAREVQIAWRSGEAPVAGAALACRSNAPCTIGGATDAEGKTALRVGPVDAAVGTKVAVEVVWAHGSRAFSRAYELVVKAEPGSVALCGGEAAARLEAAVAARSAKVLRCEEGERYAELRVDAGEAKVRCKAAFGGRDCAASVSATVRESSGGRLLRKLDAGASFIHEDERKASDRAVDAAFAALAKKVAAALPRPGRTR